VPLLKLSFGNKLGEDNGSCLNCIFNILYVLHLHRIIILFGFLDSHFKKCYSYFGEIALFNIKARKYE
jgi:hypothetical protein